MWNAFVRTIVVVFIRFSTERVNIHSFTYIPFSTNAISYEFNPSFKKSQIMCSYRDSFHVWKKFNKPFNNIAKNAHMLNPQIMK